MLGVSMGTGPNHGDLIDNFLFIVNSVHRHTCALQEYSILCKSSKIIFLPIPCPVPMFHSLPTNKKKRFLNPLVRSDPVLGSSGLVFDFTNLELAHPQIDHLQFMHIIKINFNCTIYYFCPLCPSDTRYTQRIETFLYHNLRSRKALFENPICFVILMSDVISLNRYFVEVSYILFY